MHTFQDAVFNIVLQSIFPLLYFIVVDHRLTKKEGRQTLEGASAVGSRVC